MRPGSFLTGLALAGATLLQVAAVLGALAFAFETAPAHGQQAYRILGPVPYCSATLMEGPNPRGISSASPRGEGVILLDPDVLDGLPYLRPFAVARQCAHIVLDHITPRGQIRGGQLIGATELAADCWAANALATAGETQTVLEQIALFQAETSPRPSPRAPTWQARARKVQDCLLRENAPETAQD